MHSDKQRAGIDSGTGQHAAAWHQHTDDFTFMLFMNGYIASM